MSSPRISELRLRGSIEEAVQAILDSLPKLAIVRDEDDGVGKYAGQRTVVIVGTGRERLLLFDDSFGNIRPRLDKGQVEVSFRTDEDGTVVARIESEPVSPPGPGTYVMDVVQNGITVAAVMAGYYWLRSMPMDYTLLAGVGLGGGVVWTVATLVLAGKGKGDGKAEDKGLLALVPKALAPLVVDGDGEDDDDE